MPGVNPPLEELPPEELPPEELPPEEVPPEDDPPEPLAEVATTTTEVVEEAALDDVVTDGWATGVDEGTPILGEDPPPPEPPLDPLPPELPGVQVSAPTVQVELLEQHPPNSSLQQW